MFHGFSFTALNDDNDDDAYKNVYHKPSSLLLS